DPCGALQSRYAGSAKRRGNVGGLHAQAVSYARARPGAHAYATGLDELVAVHLRVVGNASRCKRDMNCRLVRKLRTEMAALARGMRRRYGFSADSRLRQIIPSPR